VRSPTIEALRAVAPPQLRAASRVGEHGPEAEARGRGERGGAREEALSNSDNDDGRHGGRCDRSCASLIARPVVR
jgi:hypothetical protein